MSKVAVTPSSLLSPGETSRRLCQPTPNLLVNGTLQTGTLPALRKKIRNTSSSARKFANEVRASSSTRKFANKVRDSEADGELVNIPARMPEAGMWEDSPTFITAPGAQQPTAVKYEARAPNMPKSDGHQPSPRKHMSPEQPASSVSPTASSSGPPVEEPAGYCSKHEIVNHVLKNRLASALMCLELAMGEGGEGELPAETQEHIQEAKRQIHQSLDWIATDTYLGLEQSKAQVNLVTAIAEVVGPSVAIEVDLAEMDAAMLLKDEKTVALMVENIYQNALIHGEKESIQIKIAASPEPNSGTVEIVLSNTCKEANSEASTMAQLPENAQSTGKGLAHIEQLAQASGIESSFSICGKLASHKLRLLGSSFCVAEVDSTKVATTEKDTDSNSTVLSDILVMGLEDSGVLRKGYNKIVLKKFMPWCSKDSAIAGETEEEVTGFINAVLERAPEILILDNELEYGGRMYFGINICRELRRKGYTRFICMRTGGTEGDYSANKEHFDMFSSKASSNLAFAQDIHSKYQGFLKLLS